MKFKTFQYNGIDVDCFVSEHGMFESFYYYRKGSL